MHKKNGTHTWATSASSAATQDAACTAAFRRWLIAATRVREEKVAERRWGSDSELLRAQVCGGHPRKVQGEQENAILKRKWKGED